MISTILRVLGLAFSVPLIAYWFFFALFSYPLIVPADHNSEAVQVYVRASKGGLLMMAASLATAIFCLLSRPNIWRGWAILAIALSIFTAAISIPMVFPSEHAYAYYLGQHRLVGCIGNVAAIIFGTLSYRKYQVPNIV